MPQDIPVLLDAKRGDIGSTAAAYASAAFEVWAASECWARDVGYRRCRELSQTRVINGIGSWLAQRPFGLEVERASGTLEYRVELNIYALLYVEVRLATGGV